MSLLLAPHYVPGVATGSIALTDDSVVGSKYAQWTISFDGFTYKRNGAGAAHQGPAWLNPQAGMNLYEARATWSGGDNEPPGTLDVWLDMANAWTWGWANQLTGRNAELLIEVRRKVDHVVVGNATISLLAAGIE